MVGWMGVWDGWMDGCSDRLSAHGWPSGLDEWVQVVGWWTGWVVTGFDGRGRRRRGRGEGEEKKMRKK